MVIPYYPTKLPMSATVIPFSTIAVGHVALSSTSSRARRGLVHIMIAG